MNERQRQMAQEQTGKAIPYAQWKKEQAAYKKRLERARKKNVTSGK